MWIIFPMQQLISVSLSAVYASANTDGFSAILVRWLNWDIRSLTCLFTSLNFPWLQIKEIATLLESEKFYTEYLTFMFIIVHVFSDVCLLLLYWILYLISTIYHYLVTTLVAAKVLWSNLSTVHTSTNTEALSSWSNWSVESLTFASYFPQRSTTTNQKNAAFKILEEVYTEYLTFTLIFHEVRDAHVHLLLCIYNCWFNLPIACYHIIISHTIYGYLEYINVRKGK